MNRLISDELLSKFVIKEVVRGGQAYKPIFRYTGRVVVDTHEVEVGFARPDGEEELAKVYLPTVRDDGLLQRNKTLRYQVSMVIPPLCYRTEKSKVLTYLTGIVTNSIYASKLAEFMPEISASKPLFTTPLMASLINPEGDLIEDTSKWLVIDTAHAVLELFNMRIVAEIDRAQRGGWNGISASMRAIHTLLRSYIRYYGEGDEGEDYTSPSQFADQTSTEEEELIIGKIAIEDKNGALVVHKEMKTTAFTGDTPIDFCTCSQSRPIISARLKDGVEVVDCRIEGKPSFPYATWRRAIPGILSDDPHRVLVGRAISRAMRIEEPDMPLAVTDVLLNVDSVSLPGVRMTHPLNYEDGIVVSETLARKIGAFKVFVDSFTTPVSSSVTILKKQFDFSESDRDVAKKVRYIPRDRFDAPYVVRPGDIIAQAVYKGAGGETQVREFRTKLKVPAVVMKAEIVEIPNDLDEAGVLHRIVTLAFMPAQIGDKVSDAHGNKASISAILPDETMPVWEGIPTHYIATPYIMKRLGVGAEIEDKLSTIAYHTGQQAAISSLDPPGLEETDEEVSEYQCQFPAMKYTGTVRYEGKEYENIPLSLRRMFRLDNTAVEALIARSGVFMEEGKRVGRNIRLALDVVTMLSRKAGNLTSELIEKSGSREYTKSILIPMLLAISGKVAEGVPTYEVKRRLPRGIIGSPISYQSLFKMIPVKTRFTSWFKGEFWKEKDDGEHSEIAVPTLAGLELQDTVADPRAATHYGYLEYRGKFVVMPPHEPMSDLRNGSAVVSPCSVAMNKVIAEIESERAVSRMRNRSRVNQPDVLGQIAGYERYLAGVICGKNGLLRSAILPVFPHTVRAVATPFVDEKEGPFTIMVPEEGFRQLIRQSPEFAEVYQNKNRWYCVVKRDPVHRSNNVLVVRFKLWKNSSIGVSPLLIGAVDGDYDGDAMVAMFPVSAMAWSDLPGMALPLEQIYQPSKQLVGTPAKIAHHVLMQRIGWSSTFGNPHETDQLKNKPMFEMLMKSPDIKDMSAMAVTAARDFELIKDGTAFCGALGLRFIYTRKAREAHILDKAMELYHVMAQNTLDAKSGTPTPSLGVIEGFNAADEKRIVEGLEQLGYHHEDCVRELVNMARQVKASRGMTRFLRDEFPILAGMQRSSGVAEAKEIAARVLLGKPMGEGVWEVLFDYLLGRGDKTPYDFVLGSIGKLAVASEELKEKVGSV